MRCSEATPLRAPVVDRVADVLSLPVKTRQAFAGWRTASQGITYSFAMAYTFFFLLGIPFWLIPVANIFRQQAAPPPQKTAWAAIAFLAPFLIFGLGARGTLLLQQSAEPQSAVLRGYGYFTALLNVIAFFSPYFLQAAFRARYARPQERRVG